MATKAQDAKQDETAAKNGAWEFKTDHWKTMKPLLDWQRALRSVDMDKTIEQMTTIVKSWPFDGDPSDPEAYANLTPSEYGKALLEVGNHVGNFFQAALGVDQ